MIAVFLPALMLQVFTIYFIIKMFALSLTVRTWTFIDFPYWISTLVVPTFVVIYFGSTTSDKGRKLSNNIGKYLNSCDDDLCSEKVRRRKILFHYLSTTNSQAILLINKINSRPIILTCGLFDIDWKLSLSIFGTITTYMIIICQFELTQ